VCGRFVTTSSPRQLAARFAVDDPELPDHDADYNVTPRAEVLAVRERPDRPDRRRARVLSRVQWGLVPSWANDAGGGDSRINARAESIAEKPAFRDAFRRRRCIVAADAFYEWQRKGGSRPGSMRPQPYLIRRRDREPLAFAGIWAIRRQPAIEDPDAPGAWLRSCAIVTTSADAVVAPVHDRMPVVLPEDVWDMWLDPDLHDVEPLRALLVPAPDEWLEMFPVSRRVNDVRENDAGLLDPVEPDSLF
jgi:putative SOS response-associated peptidase YedK